MRRRDTAALLASACEKRRGAEAEAEEEPNCELRGPLRSAFIASRTAKAATYQRIAHAPEVSRPPVPTSSEPRPSVPEPRSPKRSDHT
jgi:hypothetical protein